MWKFTHLISLKLLVTHAHRTFQGSTPVSQLLQVTLCVSVSDGQNRVILRIDSFVFEYFENRDQYSNTEYWCKQIWAVNTKPEVSRPVFTNYSNDPERFRFDISEIGFSNGVFTSYLRSVRAGRNVNTEYMAIVKPEFSTTVWIPNAGNSEYFAIVKSQFSNTVFSIQPECPRTLPIETSRLLCNKPEYPRRIPIETSWWIQVKSERIVKERGREQICEWEPSESIPTTTKCCYEF